MIVNNIEVKKVLKFPSAPAFGKYKRFFPAESVAHPAKIHTELLEYLILNYTKEGDTVLDCMCGTGSTVVLSMLNNRNALGIDLEEKFTNWAKQAIKNVEQQQTLTPKGKGLVICGDSRKLSALLKMHKEEISFVLFSPPYGEAQKGGGIAVKGYKGKHGKDENLHLRHDRPLSDDERNISNLPVGDINSVILSPPYSTAGAKGDENPKNYIRRANDRYELMKQQGINRPKTEPGRYSGSWENIGNLPFGVDCIVPSPLFAASLRHRGQKFEEVRNKLLSLGYSEDYIRATWSQPHQCQRWAEEAYSESDENIGNFQYDTIISSPPYSDRSEHRVGYDYQARDIERGYKPYHGFREQYEDNPENIGSLKLGTILFSPPYSLGHDSGDNASEEYEIRLEEQRKHTRVYSSGNISKLSFISAILFSPPYATSKAFHDLQFMDRTSRDFSERIKRGEIKGHFMSEEARRRVFERCKEGEIENNENIGILPFGFDTIISSPPYSEIRMDGGTRYPRAGMIPYTGESADTWRTQRDQKNIGNLQHGAIEEVIDACLLSPPYFSSVSAETDANKRLKRLEREGYLDSKEWQTPNTIKTLGREAMFSKNRYSKDINNIGNIRELGISVAVFSPPYEKTVKDHGKSDRATKINVEKSISSSFAYSGDSNNIGNKNKETYLSAMKTVYEQCFLVLKPQGLLILILKNFIRDKKVVKLTDHTIRLCEGVGFKLKERLLFRLPTQSFWRRLYAQKYPEVNTSDLRYEHILIFEKKEQNGKNEWA